MKTCKSVNTWTTFSARFVLPIFQMTQTSNSRMNVVVLLDLQTGGLQYLSHAMHILVQSLSIKL